MNRLGSHWRWRVVLTAVVIALLLAAQWRLRQRGYRNVLACGGGPPILIEVDRYHSYAIEAWDPTRRTAHVILERHLDHPWDDTPDHHIVLNGHGVAWIEDKSLHVMETTQPYRVKTWNLPPSYRERNYFVGLSSNGEYAVLRRNQDGDFQGKPSPLETVVLELASGRVVSREEGILPQACGASGEFNVWPDSTRRFMQRRTLDDRGTWQELLVSEEIKLLLNTTPIGRLTPEGNLQVMDGNAATLPTGRTNRVQPIRTSFIDNRYLAKFEGDLYVGALDSPHPHELTLLLKNVWSFEFQNNGQTVSGVDYWGDVFQIDLATGRRLTVANPGTTQYRWTMAIAALLAITAGIWVYVAMAEQTFAWSFIDSLHVSWIISCAAALTVIAHLPYGHHPFPNNSRPPTAVYISPWIEVLVFGMSYATAYAVAWYWAYGKGHILVRVVGGVLWLAIIITPFVMMTRLIHYRDRLPAWGFWDRMLEPMIMFAAIVASLLAILRWFGWKWHNTESHSAPVRPTVRHFGLRSLFNAITLLAMAFALLRTMVDSGPWHVGPTEAAYAACMAAPSVGIFLPIAFAARTRGQLVVRIAVMALALCVELWTCSGLGIKVLSWALIVRGLGAAFAALLPCILLRMHGYRWSHASSVAHSPEQAVAAP